MVSKEYVKFFQKCYQHGNLQIDGLSPDQQRRLRGKASVYLSRIKQQMMEDMEALTILASVLPEKHLAEIFKEENVERVVIALLTQGAKKSRKADSHHQDMIERQHHIASMLLEKGMKECLAHFQTTNHNKALNDLVMKEAIRVRLILGVEHT